MHEQTAPAYIVGRIVRAGDAAPICNPCGGRGLTGAIMDVDRLITAFEAIFGGAAAGPELDAYTLDRRTEFLEVSSPFASLMKAMWERSDPALQKRDQAEITKLWGHRPFRWPGSNRRPVAKRPEKVHLLHHRTLDYAARLRGSTLWYFRNLRQLQSPKRPGRTDEKLIVA